MRNLSSPIALIFLLVFSVGTAQAELFNQDYSSFKNNSSVSVSEQVNCFVSDSYGQIWYGTPRGLFTFDGHSSHQMPTQTGQIYSLLVVDDKIVIGDDNGLSYYSTGDNTWHQIDAEPKEVRALLKSENQIFIGGSNGLFVWNGDPINTEIEEIEFDQTQFQTIYSLTKTADDEIFVGTYDGLFSLKDNAVSPVTFPSKGSHANTFVNSLFFDQNDDLLLIGTEEGLFSLDLKTSKIKAESYAAGNSIKAISKDARGNLIMGTDNGLFIVNNDREVRRIVHDAQNPNSLIGNIIWSVFRDASDRIWLGTENGVSLVDNDNSFVAISDFAGDFGGNTFHTIYLDSKKRLWMGGTNGLILFDLKTKKSQWFQVGRSSANLPHNRVRCIFEDTENRIWIATDGGVNHYNETTQQFEKHNITDESGNYNANWAYDIQEDSQGRLLISTCRGGVFLVDRKKFANSRQTYVAERVFTTSDGLPSDYIEKLQIDGRGNVYMLVNRSGVYVFDNQQNKIRLIDDDKTASSIFVDQNDRLWIAKDDQVSVRELGNNQCVTIDNSSQIYGFAENEEGLWVATSNGVCAIKSDGARYKMYRTKENRCFTSLFADRSDSLIYLGGIDGFEIVSSDQIADKETVTDVYLTCIKVNEQEFLYGGESMKASELELSAEQNNLSFDFSDFSYGKPSRIVYKLEGFDTDWHTLNIGENSASYLRLKHGSYVLKLGHLSLVGEPIEEKAIGITIAAPWHLSQFAIFVYALIFLALVWWIVFFFSMKQRLRIEHIEREKTLEQTRLKIDFFASVSHEFKTPMSLIIGPLSSLIDKVEDGAMKKSLSIVLQNARQLSQMINKALSFARIDNNVESEIMLQPIEIVGFAHDVFSMHRETPYAQGLEMEFESEVESAYVQADAVKLESIINNIVQNACKYTEKGSVKMQIRCAEQRVILSVADTGCGISKEDLPLVFQKFFRSAKNAANPDSSGIGLFLVRQYVEKFGGTIEAKSDGVSGSTFEISLPIYEMESAENETVENKTSGDSQLPRILIVEDNRQIAEFVESILAKDFECQIVNNGMAGYEAATKHLPSLIVADVMMPVMSGMEMAQRLKKNAATAAIPIVLLTAKDDAETRSESLANNIDGFIAKPFEAQHLLLKIKQLLHSTSLLESKIRLQNIAEHGSVEIPQSADEKFLSHFVEVVEKHIDDSELNMNVLADKTNVSSKQLYRKVKAMTGKTPTEYVSDLRMKKAALLLSQGSFTVAEVMYMVGFTNASYFAKCFAATWGMTPKVYLQSKQTAK